MNDLFSFDISGRFPRFRKFPVFATFPGNISCFDASACPIIGKIGG